MKRRLIKKLAAAAAAACIFFMGFSTEVSAAAHTRYGADFSSPYSSSDTWVIYWYLCGTDLETNEGAASDDLAELMKVQLPPNVKVVIQTGGADRWHTNGIPTGAVGRFVYDSDGLHSLGVSADVNMGSEEGLADFLRFGKENFSADHSVFVFWDHGGGSAGGICLDERYQTMISLDEVHDAFDSVYGANPDNPPFEVIGFDACLMATVDTLNSVHGFSRYMVASQETEPGCGWNYNGWVGALARDPSMGGAALGKVICDTYMDGCREYDVDDIATLSLSDVSKAPELFNAYGAYGVEALQAAAENPRQLFSQLSRGAEAAENYGGNTREQGYYDMVDMGGLARNTQSAMPATTGRLLSALDDCVLYRVNGNYRPKGLGLSCYHPYDGDADVWRAYAELDVSPASIKYLYYYLIFGYMPDAAQEYISGAPVYTQEAPGTGAAIAGSAPAHAPGPSAHPIYNVQQLEDTPVDVDRDGVAFVRLTPEAADLLSSVHCQLIYMDAAQDVILDLGSDSNIIADWDAGVFKDNFYGTWPMLDGHPVYVEITYEGDGFNLYSIPIKLNGVLCNLQVVYDFGREEYRILGARRDENTGIASMVASRELIKLKPGDVITTLHYGMTLSGSDTEYTEVEVDTFTIGANPTVRDEEVGDGTYGYFFEFVDPLNNSALSEMVTYTIRNGEITTYVGNPFAGTGGGLQPTGGSSIADSLSGGSVLGSAPSGGGSIAESLGV